jgi:hypothetical protein
MRVRSDGGAGKKVSGRPRPPAKIAKPGQWTGLHYSTKTNQTFADKVGTSDRTIINQLPEMRLFSNCASPAFMYETFCDSLLDRDLLSAFLYLFLLGEEKL